jgi:hypothetical protein
MHYYAHNDTGYVVTLDPGETLESFQYDPDDYTAVHLHKSGTPAFRVGKVAGYIIGPALLLALLSGALGLAVLGVRFLIGAFA